MGSSTNIDVRRIRETDAGTYRDIRLRALEHDQAAFAADLNQNRSHPDQYWLDSARHSATSQMFARFLAFDSEGKAVGLVGAYRFEDTPEAAELISMWVGPDARGAGLATKLIEAVVGWCRGVAVESVELWVAPGNDAATRVYERHGFVVANPRAGSKQYDECDRYLVLDLGSKT